MKNIKKTWNNLENAIDAFEEAVEAEEYELFANGKYEDAHQCLSVTMDLAVMKRKLMDMRKRLEEINK